MATNTLQRALKIQTDALRLRAFLLLRPDEDYSALAETDVLNAFASAGLPVTDRVRERVKALIERCKSHKRLDEQFVLAEGVAPTEPEDARFVFTPRQDEPLETDDDSDADGIRSGLEAVCFSDLCKIRVVESGAVVGFLQAACPGKAGTDVCGRPIPVRREPAIIELGDGIAVDADGRVVRAARAGKVHCIARRMSIEAATEIEGNVDLESGDVAAQTDVVVHGIVREALNVSTPKNVAVTEFIEAATVKAGGDVQVRGGIAGKRTGYVEAGGHLAAKFCNEANLRAGGDIFIAKEVINSELFTTGHIRMPHGTLVGGYLFARCGGDVAVAGSDGVVKTQIVMGIHPDVLDQCAEIDKQVEKNQEAAAKIRQNVQPLMAQLKRLLPAQRERATELLYEADRIEEGVRELLAKKEALLKEATPPSPPFLFVARQIFPGVTITIGDLTTTFTNECRGPVRITRQRVNRVEEIVAINERLGTVAPLHSRDYRLKPD